MFYLSLLLWRRRSMIVRWCWKLTFSKLVLPPSAVNLTRNQVDAQVSHANNLPHKLQWPCGTQQVGHHPEVGDYSLENAIFVALHRAVDAAPFHYGQASGGFNADSIDAD